MTYRTNLGDPADRDLQRLNREAVELAQRGSFTNEAVQLNEAILDVDPDNVDAQLRLLRCRTQRSEFVQAVALIEHLDALNLEESDRDYVNRFRPEAVAGATCDRERAERDEAAQQERQKLLASARALSSAQEAQALGIAYRRTDHELAIAYLERGLEVATTWEETLSVLSVLAPTYRDSGDLTAAFKAYERAISIEPAHERNKAIYTSMTATLRRMERLDEAREHGEELARHFPDDPYVLNTLGAVYARMSVRDESIDLAAKAESCFTRAAELDPGARDNLRQLRNLIGALEELGSLLEQAGDMHGVEVVRLQKERIEEHLARLSRGP